MGCDAFLRSIHKRLIEWPLALADGCGSRFVWTVFAPEGRRVVATGGASPRAQPVEDNTKVASRLGRATP